MPAARCIQSSFRPRQEASEPRNLCRQRFFEDESFFNPKAGLEGRLAAAEDVMDSSQRLQLRFATQQVVLQTMADLEVNTAVCTRLLLAGFGVFTPMVHVLCSA